MEILRLCQKNNMTFHTLLYVLQKLKAEGLPASRPYFNMLERKNIFPAQGNVLIYREKPLFGSKLVRIFNDEEVVKIVEIVKQFSKK